MEHIKYKNISRIKEEYELNFRKGNEIIIQEKIDGANIAIRYDSETDMVIGQSRNNLLNEESDFNGFIEWKNKLDKNLVKSVLGDNLVLYGEWLVPHRVVYPMERYKNAYFYDVLDIETKSYLPQDKVKEIVNALDLIYVPVFYEGEFVSWEHCRQFVGQTQLGGETGEGIVVKNITRLNKGDYFYLKIVHEKFSEIKIPKWDDSFKTKRRTESELLAETIITSARIEKILEKLVDEGVLPENWGVDEQPLILKNLTKFVYQDCMKEEPETVNNIENFGKIANKVTVRVFKEILKRRQEE